MLTYIPDRRQSKGLFAMHILKGSAKSNTGLASADSQIGHSPLWKHNWEASVDLITAISYHHPVWNQMDCRVPI